MNDNRLFQTPSLARLHALAERAVKEGIELSQMPGTSRWSAVNPKKGSRYTLVVLDDGSVVCNCPAGSFGSICKHRIALLMRHLGTLPPLPPPEPTELFPDAPIGVREFRDLTKNDDPTILAEHERERDARRRVVGE